MPGLGHAQLMLTLYVEVSGLWHSQPQDCWWKLEEIHLFYRGLGESLVNERDNIRLHFSPTTNQNQYPQAKLSWDQSCWKWNLLSFVPPPIPLAETSMYMWIVTVGARRHESIRVSRFCQSIKFDPHFIRIISSIMNIMSWPPSLLYQSIMYCNCI